MTIEEGLVIELSVITGLSGKVFPITAQQDTATPYLTYSKNDTERLRTLLSHDGYVEVQFQFDIFHTGYSSLLSLKRLVIAEIKTWERTNIGVTGPYIQACTLDEEIETYDDETKLFQGTIDFKICYNEN
jgi:hypothetical protein